ncbi:MAG TPA: GntR family transcriptional regulator [Candidatus Dormibacteraeota bacterium]
MTAGVEPAGSGRLATLAYQHLRREILRRRLGAGTVLNEGSIASSLGMSKTPVRHALHALRQEGLLEAGPRRQMVVRNLSPVQRTELVAVREALERIAVSHACQHMADDDFDHLRTLLRRQRRFAEAGEEDAFVDCDEDMHIAIAARSGLHLVPQFLNQLRGFVRLMQMRARRDPGHLFQVLEEHVRLVDAMEARNEEEALAALAHHLHTSEYVIAE